MLAAFQLAFIWTLQMETLLVFSCSFGWWPGSGPRDGRNWSQGTFGLSLWPLRCGWVFPSEGPRGAASSCVESGLHLAWYVTLGWAEQPSRNYLVLSPNAVAQVWCLSLSFFWLYIFIWFYDGTWVGSFTYINKYHFQYESHKKWSYSKRLTCLSSNCIYF